MVKEDKNKWKANYFLKLTQCLEEYSRIFLVGVDYVGSKQMQNIRISMRDKAVLLLGKNTMMRKVIRNQMEKMPQLEKLLPLIKGNIGFVFTNLELTETRDLILANRVPAAAKAGVVAPLDVSVSSQVTALGPEKTSFFQALQIQTKISRGNIEILNAVHLITAGERVGASESALLGMLGITPFSYGLEIEKVYDSGTVFDPKILDITDEDLRATFMEGVRNLASVCLAVGYPTMASVPHSIANGFKNLMAVAAVTDITFKEVETLKEYLADPSKFAVAAPAASAGTVEKKVEAVKEESEAESEEDMGFGLFD